MRMINEDEDHIGDFAKLPVAGLLLASLLLIFFLICVLCVFCACFIRVSSVASLPARAPDRWHARQILVSS